MTKTTIIAALALVASAAASFGLSASTQLFVIEQSVTEDDLANWRQRQRNGR